MEIEEKTSDRDEGMKKLSEEQISDEDGCDSAEKTDASSESGSTTSNSDESSDEGDATDDENHNSSGSSSDEDNDEGASCGGHKTPLAICEGGGAHQTTSKKKGQRQASKPTKKKQKRRGCEFVISEAEVDDTQEEESDSEQDEVMGQFVLDGDVSPANGPTARQIERRNQAQNARNITDMNAEEIEAYLKEKYGDCHETDLEDYYEESGLTDELVSRKLQPSIKDPPLWMVRCCTGTENEVLLQLTNKIIAYMNSDEPFAHCNIIVPAGVRRVIYIEAFKKSQVLRLIEGVSKINKFKTIVSVPLQEMTHVLHVNKMTKLGHSSWVRVRSGTYAGDVGRVEYMDTKSQKVGILLVPRVDLTMKKRLREESESDSEEENASDALKAKKPCKEITKKTKKRPRPKLFDTSVAIKAGCRVVSNNGFVKCLGNKFTSKGFVFKELSLSSLITEGVVPNVSELAPFGVGVEQQAVLAAKMSKSNNINPGDVVEVCNGELKNLRGLVRSVKDGEVFLKPMNMDILNEEIAMDANDVCKWFAQGDHVRVLYGRYEGNTGLVLHANDERVVLITDHGLHELVQEAWNLQLCPQDSIGMDPHAKLQFGDLVTIDVHTPAVVTQLTSDMVTLLNCHGKLVKMKSGAVQARPQHPWSKTCDTHGNAVQHNDKIRIVDGPNVGISGYVRKVYRKFVFVFSSGVVENGGLLAAHSRNIELLNVLSTVVPSHNMLLVSSPNHCNQPRSNKPYPNNVAERKDRDVTGKDIKVIKGVYKGYQGTVRYASQYRVSVDLSCSGKTVMLQRDHVVLLNQEPPLPLDAPNPNNFYSRGDVTPSACSVRTPMYSMPGDGGKTPVAGWTSPSHSVSGARSAWDPHSDYSANSPRYSLNADSGISSSRTPLYHTEYSNSSMDAQVESSEGNLSINTEGYATGKSNYSISDSASSSINPVTSTPKKTYASSATGSSFYSPQDTPGTASPPPPSYSGSLMSAMSPNTEEEDDVDDVITIYTEQSSFSSMPTPSYAPTNMSSCISPISSAPSPASSTVSPFYSLPLGDWVTAGLVVKLTTCEENKFVNQMAKVIKVSETADWVLVQPLNKSRGDRGMKVRMDQLQPVAPVEKERLRIIAGEHQLKDGVLLSVDLDEGVIQADEKSKDDLLLLPMHILCRLA